MNRLRQYISEEISLWWVLIGVILYTYGFLLRVDLFNESIIMELTINQWDVILSLLNDLYLNIIIIQIILLFLSIRIIRKNTNNYIFFRAGSYKKWIWITLREFISKIIILFFLFLIVNLLLIIGVPKGVGWSDFSLSEGVGDYASTILSAHIASPMWALIIHFVMLGITYITFHVLLALAYLVSKNIFYPIVFSVCIWLISFMSFKWFSEDFSFLIIANHLSLAYGTNSYNNIYIPVVIISIYLTISLALCLMVDINLKKLPFNLKTKRYKGRE